MQIVIIGSGNVATHLAKEMQLNNFKIAQVYSNTLENAKQLASELKASYTNEIKNINSDADLYIIAIKDSEVKNLVSNLKISDNRLIVHTSGSLNIDILSGFNNYGVVYPLQTFNKNIPLNFKEIPFCIEANSLENEEKLFNIFKKISDNTLKIDSLKRGKLHLSAVFACNFTNYMYNIANEILQESEIDFSILKPLIKQTATKLNYGLPSKMQTGPAIRNDINIISKHLLMIENEKYKEIYKLISNSISEDLHK